MKRILIIFIFVYGVSILCYGQRMPFFIHHVNNPYLYNPAFAGSEKHAVLFLTHHQQWLGVEGAPVSSNLSFHTPAGQANPYSLGGDITSDRIGILNYMTIRGTFGYLVPLGIEKEHYVRFALSAGLGNQQLNLNDVSIEDDFVLQNALKHNTFWEGRFGLLYHLEKLNLGFALPHIFSNPLLNPDGLTAVKLDAFSRFIVSANYRINLNATGGVAFEPTVLYNVSKELGNQAEAFGVLHIKDAFWVGGGYQQQSGMAGLLGFKIKNMTIGYAYGMGGNALSSFSNGTHEAQIGIMLGKKQAVMKRKPRLSTSNNGEKVPEAAILAAKKVKEEKAKKQGKTVPDRKKTPLQQENPQTDTTETIGEPGKETSYPAPIQKDRDYQNLNFESLDKGLHNEQVVQLGEGKQGNTQKEIINKKQDQMVIPDSVSHSEAQQKEEKTDQTSQEKRENSPEPAHPLALKAGKYIVTGTFSQESNAQQLIQKLTAEGYHAQLGYYTEKKFYYVYVSTSPDVAVLQKELEELKKLPLFENAWILSVEE